MSDTTTIQADDDQKKPPQAPAFNPGNFTDLSRQVMQLQAQRRGPAEQFERRATEDADTLRSLAGQERARPEVAQTAAPTPPQPDPVAGFASAASVFATIAAAFTHTPAIAAMNGMASAINARNQNDWKGYEAGFKAWQENSELALKREAEHRAKFNELAELTKTDLAAAEAGFKVLDAQYGDEIGTRLQLGRDYTSREQLMNSRAQLAQSMALNAPKLEASHELLMAQRSGDPERIARAKQEYAFVLNPSAAAGGNNPAGIALQRYLQQYPNATAEDIQKFIGGFKPPSATAGKEQDARELATAKFKELHGRDPTQADEPEMAGLRMTARQDANGVIDDKAAEFVAGRVLAGDKSATVGMGRSQANVSKVTNAIMKIADGQGLSPNDVAIRIAEFQGVTSGERTLGTRAANMEIAANVVRSMAPIALEASKKVNRSDYPTLNSVILAADRHTGGEDVVRFGQAANAIIYEYSKFLNPTGIPTDADKARSTEILNTAWSRGQFEAALDQIVNKEIPAGAAGIAQTRAEFRGGLGSVVAPQIGAPAAAQALPPRDQLQSGTIYQTSRGPARWDGTHFVPVQ